MRGRILLAMVLTLAALAACSRKDSLYMEPGKQGTPDSKPAKAMTPAAPAVAASPAKP
jgi:predicted small lipoprotein YifL